MLNQREKRQRQKEMNNLTLEEISDIIEIIADESKRYGDSEKNKMLECCITEMRLWKMIARVKMGGRETRKILLASARKMEDSKVKTGIIDQLEEKQ